MLTPEVANYVKKIGAVAKLPLPQLEALPRILLEVAEQIAALTGTWNPVGIFTPDNTREEKAKFIEAFNANEVYNPQFIYSYAENFQFRNSQKKLRELCRQVRLFTPQTQIERLARVALYFKIKDDLATCDLVEGVQNKDEEKIGKALQQKYPGVDQVLLKIAKADFADRVSGVKSGRTHQQGILTQQEIKYLQNKEFDAEKIKEAFTWALEQYGMLRTEDNKSGFAVVIDEKVTAIDVRDKSINGPSVFIPADRKLNGINLIELIGHEIEGHARQSKNGEKLFLIGGGMLKVDDEVLYEGLAKRYDDLLSKKLVGTSGGAPMPYYTFAVHAAEAGRSFYDIFHEQFNMRLRVALKKVLNESLPNRSEIEQRTVNEAMDRAWMTTYRVMRGHVDTINSHGFAMAKDLAYLRGYIIDKQLVEMGIGYLNEAAIIASGGLQLLAEIALTEDSLPLPYQDVATKYWEDVLKPQWTAS